MDTYGSSTFFYFIKVSVSNLLQEFLFHEYFDNARRAKLSRWQKYSIEIYGVIGEPKAWLIMNCHGNFMCMLSLLVSVQ